MPTHVISANGLPADPATGDIPVVMYQRKTIITDAQIKALSTTYIEVVPAPGEGKALLFHSGMVFWFTISGAYSNTNNTDTTIFVYGDWDCEASNYARIAQSPVNGAISIQNAPLSADFQAPINAGFNLAITNRPLKLAMWKDGANQGDSTGGHADNTLEVTVFYSVVDL